MGCTVNSEKQRYTVFQSPADLNRYLAAKIKLLADDAVSNGTPAFIAVSGGSTPVELFRLLASPAYHDFPWQGLRIFWVDERGVPPSSPESNYGVFRSILTPSLLPEEYLFRMEGELHAPEAAQRYEQKINELLLPVKGEPVFDLILLGMGEDGHTASIFPDRMDLLHDTRLCASAAHPSSSQPRITMTGTLISRAKNICIAAIGEKKAQLVSDCLTDANAALVYPAATLGSMTNSHWLIDLAAAQHLL